MTTPPKRRARDVVYEKGGSCENCPLNEEGTCDEHILMVTAGKWVKGGVIMLFPVAIMVAAFLIEIRSEVAVLKVGFLENRDRIIAISTKLDKLCSGELEQRK